jgi:D-3-phosphoglycerate dehydrogenase
VRAVLGPYLILGEKLGRLQAQLLDAAPLEVTIEYAGEAAAHDVKPLTMAVLHGLLARALSLSVVNYVNAPSIARERGIKVVEARVSTAKGFSNMVTLRITTAKSTSVVAGVIFGQSVIRLVRINDFFLDADPEGYILMLHNQDVPGVVGNVGTVLAECKINIARLELGRERIGGKAISLIHVDDQVPDAVLNRLRTLPNIIAAQLLEFDVRCQP